MRLLFLPLALAFAGCGGQAPTKTDRPPSEIDEDIETPWRDSQKGESQVAPSLLLPRRSAQHLPRSSKNSRPSSGVLIDFEVKDTDLHDVFRLLADTAGINIVVADSVAGRVSLRLQQVAWQQILDALVNLKNLTLSEKAGIYYVQ